MNISVIRMFFKLFIVLIVFIIFCQCQDKKFERIFYIDDLNLYIQIEEMKKLNKRSYLFRVYINDTIDQKSEDYIDISYVPSDMPSIIMVFPQDDSNNIYIIDYFYGEIRSNSTQFNIIYPEFNRNERNERLGYRKWCDSVMNDNNSINVRLSSYLKDLEVWDGNGNFSKRVLSYDKSF